MTNPESGSTTILTLFDIKSLVHISFGLIITGIRFEFTFLTYAFAFASVIPLSSTKFVFPFVFCSLLFCFVLFFSAQKSARKAEQTFVLLYVWERIRSCLRFGLPVSHSKNDCDNSKYTQNSKYYRSSNSIFTITITSFHKNPLFSVVFFFFFSPFFPLFILRSFFFFFVVVVAIEMLAFELLHCGYELQQTRTVSQFPVHNGQKDAPSKQVSHS